MSETPKKHGIDIFRVLDHVSMKDANFYQSLPEQEQKAFQPLVVARWLTGTMNARQIYFLNELVNPFVFSLSKHKELLFDLMTICASGKKQRYFWNKAQSKKTTSTPECVSVVREFLGYNSIHAIEALPLLSDDDILDYAEQLGRQKEDIAKIKRELKGR